MGHAETIAFVREDHFEVVSNNAASDYFVSWIAVGGERQVNRLQSGDMVMHWEQPPKLEAHERVLLNLVRFAEPPNLQLTPVWHTGVGHAETIIELGTSHAVIASNNVAQTYRPMFLATGTIAGRVPRNEFAVGDVLVRTGVRRDLRSALKDIDLSVPPERSLGENAEFAEPPVVVVTPFWEGRTGVGHAETINRISTTHVQTASGNAGSDYGVSWIAMGPRRR